MDRKEYLNTYYCNLKNNKEYWDKKKLKRRLLYLLNKPNYKNTTLINYIKTVPVIQTPLTLIEFDSFIETIKITTDIELKNPKDKDSIHSTWSKIKATSKNYPRERE